MDKTQPELEHIEDTVVSHDYTPNENTNPGTKSIMYEIPEAEKGAANVEEAQHGADFEHGRKARDAFRQYRKAVFFSLGISLTIIMEGYDLGLMSNFFAVPQFRQRFGHEQPDGGYQVSAGWQAALSAISSVGAIFGLVTVGYMIDPLGFRRSMAVALICLTGAVFIPFFANGVVMLFLGQLACGVPLGMFQGMASSYAVDVAPLALRSFLTSYIALCWGLGQFICVGVLKGCLNMTSEWAYRIPFAVQWVWLPPIAIIVYFAPESPWWLVRKGRVDEARGALRSLASSDIGEDEIESSLNLMRMTNDREQGLSQGTSYLDLFKNKNIRRSEITALVWVCQVASGVWFNGQIAYFMEQAGASHSIAFNFSLGMTGLGVAGTMMSWFIVPIVGRRPVYILGLAGMCGVAFILGFLAIPQNVEATMWTSGGLLILNNLFYKISVGPVCYTIITEIPSTRLRNRTIAFARSCYLVCAVGANFLQPAILNPTAWNLKGKGGFIWGSTAAIAATWVFFRVPETGNRLSAEMDILFNHGVSARKFKHSKVDIITGRILPR